MKAAFLTALLLCAPSFAQEEFPVDPKPAAKPDSMTAKQALVGQRRAVAWMLGFQNEDGSFASPVPESVLELGFALETYYAWQLASQGLAIRALLAVEESPERRACLDKAARWFLTTRMPKRGDGWDVDYMWTMVYGIDACVALQEDERFAKGDWPVLIAERGAAFVDLLERNQSYTGGWGYYDDPPFSRRPKWGTLFSTAPVLLPLEKAIAFGWAKDAGAANKTLKRAMMYVQGCALPNGAYAYDLRIVPRFAGESINNVKGSLGRIQVGNWARRVMGDERVTDETIREGLALFFKEHRFLDAAFMRPFPHEAYYANAAYFYHFGHYYAAQAIELLPLEERAALHAKLRPELIKSQSSDGSLTDFLGTGYLRVASTAFTIMALEMGKDD